jgi:uncharacterized protein
MHSFTYTEKACELQARFDTSALAAAELQVIVHDELTLVDRGFIEAMEMFWLASVDPKGSPTVSYKGGLPGFVKMPDDKTILFPCFDGNGMFYSMGNIVGLWPGAQFAVKVKITAIVQNCPRYIPRMQRLEGSRYIPDVKTGEQPIPGWKRIDAIQPVLPKRDQNKADTVGGLITMDQWGEMALTGDPMA